MLTPVRTDPVSVARTNVALRTDTVPVETWILVGVVAVGAALRFATIASQSYWVDEATTVHELHLSFGALLHAIRVNETTPPLYFVLAWVWAKVFGTGEVGLRSMSALLGTGLIVISYLCARELVSRAAGLLAAAFAAVSPFMIWYSQEARSYMLFAALCGLSFLFFARALRTRATRDVVWWAVTSALAVGTHFFAGFLVAPEAIWLLIVLRSRVTVLACAGVAIVQAALVPLAAADTSHPLGWIQQFPLSTRIQQVPVDLGLGSLYQSSLVNQGLIGAAVLAVVVVALLALGGGSKRRRSAAVAAAIAAAVILVPLVLADLGRDYYVPRNLTAAWIPLAVLVAAACTAPRTLPVGAALAAVLLGAFVWAGIRIDSNAAYERPNWRGVASALGASSTSRAIVAYDGGFATQPLAVYLQGVPWTLPAQAPISVNEVDVVGNVWQTITRPLPSGTRLIGSRAVDDILVERFAVDPAWRAMPSAIGARAGALLGPAPATPAVLLQRPAP
jgi:mannosyltransferase